MMMVSSRSINSSSSCPVPAVQEKNIPISNSSTPPHDQFIASSNWKLYQNPFYNKQPPYHHRGNNTKFPRRPHLPLSSSARKIAASFWDLAFFRPTSLMEQAVGKGDDDAAAQVEELRAELERERWAHRKLEYLNKKLAKELAEERQGREAVERVCEELAKEISCDRESIDRMKKEIEEERKMLRMAEVLREERVQMKLAEAKIFLEEKMSQLEETNKCCKELDEDEDAKRAIATTASAALASSMVDLPEKPMRRLVLGEKLSSSREENVANSNSDCSKSGTVLHRRLSPSPEPENPHIKRGIKGFVEFPRVVRAIGSKGRNWGAKKIECQKAQIRILLKQRSTVRSTSDSLIWSSS
ncbi:hypothetical protein CDL15_Pgr027959 [Punica granatum]|nr:hypothetical protein CDL15_Pgr027959 [Punica granatum]